MNPSKLKLVALFVGTAALLETAASGKGPAPGPTRTTPKQPRLDLVGDPLPRGAIVRLGTTRLHHAGGLYGPAFSPDGKTFVTADGCGLVRLWEVSTGKELRRYAKPGRYFHLGIVSGGKVVAAVTEDGLLRRWDLGSGKDLGSVQLEQPCRQCQAAFSPNGKWLVMSYRKLGYYLRLFDVSNGKEIHRLPTFIEDTAAVAFSPDSRLLAAGGWFVEIWDVHTGKRLRRTGRGAVRCLAFSAEGKTLATAGGKGQPIGLWDVATGKARTSFPVAAQQQVTCLAFSANDKILFAGADHRTLVLDAATGKEKGRLGKNRFGFRLVLVSPDGKVLALAGWDSKLELLNAVSLKPLLRLPGYSAWVTSVGYAPDSKVVATGGEGTARLWDVASGRELRRFQGGEVVRAVSISRDGKLLVAGCDDAVRVWEIAGGKELAVLRDSNLLAVSPDGNLVAATVKGKPCLVLWEPRSGRVLRRLTPVGLGNASIFAVSFAPDGRTVAVVFRDIRPGALAAGDAVIYLWEVASGKERRTLTRQQFGVRSMALSPDGRTLAAGTEQGTLHFWDVTTGKEERVLTLHPRQMVDALAFSPDGRTLATVGRGDGAVRLWEVLSGRARGSFPGHYPFGTSVAFAPDGRTVTSCGTDGTAVVWDLADPIRPTSPQR